MAHFMPKLCEKVLDCLYQCFGKNEYRIWGWGKITKGYGLKPSDFDKFKPSEFDKFDGCSRSIFYKCRDFLLTQKCIEKLKTNKTITTNHKPRYAITLLGIIKLFQTKIIGTEAFKDIMKIFADNYILDDEGEDQVSFWYSITGRKQPKNSFEAIFGMFQGIKQSLLCQVLTEVLKGIEINSNEKTTEVSFSINISKYNRVTLWKFIFNDVIINCIWSPVINKHGEDRIKYVETNWTIEELNFHIVEFVLESMWYILSKYYSKELPEYWLRGTSVQAQIEGTGPIHTFIDYTNGMAFEMFEKM